MTSIADNLVQLRQRIENTLHRCGRPSGSVKLLAVSKTFPPEAVKEALSAGQFLFGENRVQEAAGKIPRVNSTLARWHLIGHLQSNKAKLAVEMFDVIETIDSEKLAKRVASCAEAAGRRQSVFLQVNVGEESQKSGVSPLQVPALVETIQQLPSLQLDGLMAIPPFSEEPEDSRPFFRQLRELQEKLNSTSPVPLRELSMGMSHDFEVAIEEGATLVRVGTAIFGERD